MSKKTIVTSLLLLSLTFLYSQEIKEAFINADGQVSTQLIENKIGKLSSLINNEQLENFPLSFTTDYGRYNHRGLTTEDVNGDGLYEIFHVTGSILYAISDNGDILWQKSIEGSGIYPPTVVDLNGDGNYQVIQPTGSVVTGGPGRVYMVDALTGEDYDGWPLEFATGVEIRLAVSVADLTGNDVMDIVFVEIGTKSRVHAVDISGNPINENWPMVTPPNVATTPSLGDINNDGIMDIVFAISTASYYAVNSETGELLPGFPKALNNRFFSYQAPILVDLTGDGFLEIVAASHGNISGYFVLDYEGNILDGWPHNMQFWTYTAPSVADIDGDGEYELFFSDPYYTSPGVERKVVYAFNKEGDMIEDMSVTKYGGSDGVMTIADINDDGIMDIIFPSRIAEEDHGFIHAYSLDGSGELEGFPKRPRGFTYLNGAVLGATADNKLKLIANSHTRNSTNPAVPDTTFVNVYEMNVPYNPDKILFNGFKGDNSRSGLIVRNGTANTSDFNKTSIEIYPNPSDGKIVINSPIALRRATIQVIDMRGRLVWLEEKIDLSKGSNTFDFSTMESGTYLFTLSDGKSHSAKMLVIK